MQRTSSSRPQAENSPDLQRASKSGLLIENRINRGISYTDPQGRDFSIRYIPITITNDTTTTIEIKIAFAKEYHHPQPGSDEKFKLIPLPSEWARDGVGISEDMMDELPIYIENPVLKKSIASGEKVTLAIASIYPRPTQSSGVLPRVLFAQGDNRNYSDCDWRMDKERSSTHEIPLRLKTIFGEKCSIIPCGQLFCPGE